MDDIMAYGKVLGEADAAYHSSGCVGSSELNLFI